MVRTFVHGSAQYGKESGFKNLATMTRSFGFEAKIAPLKINQNQLELKQFNSGLLAKFGYGVFDGSFSVEHVWSDPWIMDMILGTPTVQNNVPVGGVTTYTYTYQKLKNTFSVEADFAAELENVVDSPLGCTVASWNISCALGQWAKVRMECLYAQLNAPTTSLAGSVASDIVNNPYTFESATLKTPIANGAIAEVQSAEVTFNPNPIYGAGWNSKNPSSISWGEFRVTGRMNIAFKDRTWVNNVLGRTEIADLEMKFLAGTAGTNTEKSTTITLTGVSFPTLDRNYVLTDPVFADLPFTARIPQVVAINAQSSVP